MVDVESSGIYAKGQKGTSKDEAIGGKVLTPKLSSFRIPKKDAFAFESSTDETTQTSLRRSTEEVVSRKLETQRHKRKIRGYENSNSKGVNIETYGSQSKYSAQRRNSVQGRVPKTKKDASARRLSLDERHRETEKQHKPTNEKNAKQQQRPRPEIGKHHTFKDLVNMFSDENEDGDEILESLGYISDDDSPIEFVPPKPHRSGSPPSNHSKPAPKASQSKNTYTKQLTYDIFGSASEQSSNDDDNRNACTSTDEISKVPAKIPKKSAGTQNFRKPASGLSSKKKKLPRSESESELETNTMMHSRNSISKQNTSNYDPDELTAEIFGTPSEYSDNDDDIENSTLKSKLAQHINGPRKGAPKLKEKQSKAKVTEAKLKIVKQKLKNDIEQFSSVSSGLRVKSSKKCKTEHGPRSSGISRAPETKSFPCDVSDNYPNSSDDEPSGTDVGSMKHVPVITKLKSLNPEGKKNQKMDTTDSEEEFFRKGKKRVKNGLWDAENTDTTTETSETASETAEVSSSKKKEGLQMPDKVNVKSGGRPKMPLREKEIEKIREIVRQKDRKLAASNTQCSGSKVALSKDVNNNKREQASNNDTVNKIVNDSVTRDLAATSDTVPPFMELVVSRVLEASTLPQESPPSVATSDVFAIVSKNTNKVEESLREIEILYAKTVSKRTLSVRIVTVLNKGHYSSVLPKQMVGAIPEFIITTITQ